MRRHLGKRARSRPAQKVLGDLSIRADVFRDYADLFGRKEVNGRQVCVEELIARCTKRFGEEFDALLQDRRRFRDEQGSDISRHGFVDPLALAQDADGNTRTAARIRQGMLDGFFARDTPDAWRLGRIPEEVIRPGLQGTGPADDLGMAMGALNAGGYGATSWMWDWEDAGNDYQDKLYLAWRNLKEIAAGEWTGKRWKHPKKKKEYSIDVERKKWPSIFHRVPGIHLRNRQISLGGKDVPAIIPALVLHAVHNFESMKRHGSNIYYYIPKIETPREALLVAKLLKELEQALGLERGTIKIEMLNERARFTVHQEQIMWVMRDWLIGPNVGRWDYINSRIEMLKDDPRKVFPDPDTVGMTEPTMTEYTRRNALLTVLAGGFPVGGMAAVMKRGDAPERVNAAALRNVFFDKLRERLTGIMEIEGRDIDAYRQSWVATTEPEYVIAGAIPLIFPREAMQDLVEGYPSEAIEGALKSAGMEKPFAALEPKQQENIKDLFRGVTQDEREKLQKLEILDAHGKIKPHKVTVADLDPRHLYSRGAWDRLFRLPEGQITEDGLRYAVYMACEYMFQQVQGNNAAAIDDYKSGNRLMNDFATYEIFWHWLWSAYHHRVEYIDANGDRQALTWEKMTQFLDDHAVASEKKMDGLIARGRMRFDRAWSPVVVDILRRQLRHPRWITYGSRILLRVIDAQENGLDREEILQGIFSKTREKVCEGVAAGTLPDEALRAHDFVYDVLGEGQQAPPPMDSRQIEGLDESDRKHIRRLHEWMHAPRFRRIAPARHWTAREIFDLLGTIDEKHELHNYLALKMYDLMAEADRTGIPVTTGGVMDGPSAALMAEAGHVALYFSGWQMSHHWGQPDLAKYPLDTVPTRIAEICKYLKNKHEDQQIRFKRMMRSLNNALAGVFRDIEDSAQRDLLAKRDACVQKLAEIVHGEGGKDLAIFRDAIQKTPDACLQEIFGRIVGTAIARKGKSTQKQRKTLCAVMRHGLERQLVDYLIPIFADGDTGHQSIKEMIRLYVQAGSASIHLEDQAHGLKKCGHMAGKVVVSTREHYLRLLEARKEADKLGSQLVLIARTDAQSAKLLQSNEDPRDHCFIKGTTRKDIPSLAYVIRLARREVEEFDHRADTEETVRGLKETVHGADEAEIRKILSAKTPEQLVEDLDKDFPRIARHIRAAWAAMGSVQGVRLDPTMVLRHAAGGQLVGDVSEIWANREAIEFDELPLLKKTTVLVDMHGEERTVGEILDREPQTLGEELKAMAALTDAWATHAQPKTYAAAVAETILSSQGGPYRGMSSANRARLRQMWMRATDPLKTTLSITQMQALARTAPFRLEIYWDWEKTRAYEGYYQLDSDQGMVNCSMRSRVFGRIADSVWMEQERPNVAQGQAFVANVRSDKRLESPFFSINLSPSFNWSNPESWSGSLNQKQIDSIKKAMAQRSAKGERTFRWDNPATWGKHRRDVQTMVDAIAQFSSQMGKAGFGFQFVTIWQDHVSSRALSEVARALAVHGAAGFVFNVQQIEQLLQSRFERHQTAAGVTRVTCEDDLHTRGASATGAAGKDSTETQFGSAAA